MGSRWELQQLQFIEFPIELQPEVKSMNHTTDFESIAREAMGVAQGPSCSNGLVPKQNEERTSQKPWGKGMFDDV